MPEHIGHEKNNIYYNFYLKKYKNYIIKQNKIEDNKNTKEYYKFKDILFKDYIIFDKNKIYNNYIINNYDIIKKNPSSYKCDNLIIDYTSTNLLEQNLIHKINNEKHFYTSNPMQIKLNTYSNVIKLINYTLLDNIIYINNNTENILVLSIYSMEDDKYVNNKKMLEKNLDNHCYLLLKNIDTNKYIFKQTSPVIYEMPKYSVRFILFEKDLNNFKINYLIERIKKQIAIFDLNKLEYIYEYIYYNNNIDNNDHTNIIYIYNKFYLCVVFHMKITLINIKTKQINAVIKYELYVNNIFKIKNVNYVITENISFNFYTNKKIQNYDVFRDPYVFLEGVNYFNYKKKDTLIFYLQTNEALCLGCIMLVDFFSGERIKIFDLNVFVLLIDNIIFWNSNYIFLFIRGHWRGSKEILECKVFDIFQEEEKCVMEIEDLKEANRVMKFFNQNLGEILLYSYKNTGEIYIYKCLEQKNQTLITKDEIINLLYPLKKKI